MERLNKGPENIPKILKESGGLPKESYGYVDKSFFFESMIHFEGDSTTAAAFSEIKTKISNNEYIFKYWTLQKNVDLFDADGTISFNQIN